MAKFSYDTIIVHSGVFHTDDVFCVAMAEIINPCIKVERVARLDSLNDISETTIVCDIGGGKFDHHQSDAEVAEDGHKHAACGLFFREFWEDLFPDEKSANKFRDKYIIPVELQDNGVESNPLSLAISRFNPLWTEEGTESIRFKEAVDFVKRLIKNEIEYAKSIVLLADEIVEQACESANDKRIVILERYVPYMGTVIKHDEPKFIIYPSNRGGYILTTVPDMSVETGGKFNPPRIPLSKDWLQNKPEGCTFCHPALFISSFDTEENAIKAAKSLLE